MPTRKIADLPCFTRPCYSPEHDPPSMMVYAPGTYEHECPACGRILVFTVAGPVWSVTGTNRGPAWSEPAGWTTPDYRWPFSSGGWG